MPERPDYQGIRATETKDRTSSTRRAYDGVAADFAERTRNASPGATEFLERFLTALSPSGLVADLGCGPGHELTRIANAGHNALGVDLSFGLLFEAPVEARRVQGDLRSLPIRDGTLDAIWSSAALLHIDRDQLPATLVEWCRTLRAGGLLGMATSLGGDQGWEMVPAAPGRVPEIAPGSRRWFVHHDEDDLFDAIEQAGCVLEWTGVRSSHRDWLQILARIGA